MPVEPALDVARLRDTRPNMIAVISPAKSLDFDKPLPSLAATEPRYAGEATALAAAAAKLGPKKLGELMSISPKLAKLNADRFKGFADAPQRPAVYAFAGDVYQALEVRSLDEEAVAYAQDHLRILSGLYGLLRPLDRIRPYRLEMGTRWAPGRKRTLYDHWGKRVADALATDLALEGSGTIVNLASNEYWHAIETAPPSGARILTIDFREETASGLRFNTFAGKRARGLMARWIVEHRPERADALKGFDLDGYAYAADHSAGDRWTFVRAK